MQNTSLKSQVELKCEFNVNNINFYSWENKFNRKQFWNSKDHFLCNFWLNFRLQWVVVAYFKVKNVIQKSPISVTSNIYWNWEVIYLQWIMFFNKNSNRTQRMQRLAVWKLYHVIKIMIKLLVGPYLIAISSYCLNNSIFNLIEFNNFGKEDRSMG